MLVNSYRNFINQKNIVSESFGQMPLLLPAHSENPLMNDIRSTKVFNLKGVWYSCHNNITELAAFFRETIELYGNHMEINNIKTKDKLLIDNHKMDIFAIKNGESHNGHRMERDSLLIEDTIDGHAYVFNMDSPSIENYIFRFSPPKDNTFMKFLKKKYPIRDDWNKIKFLDCSRENIESLDGIQNLTNLEMLNCGFNKIENLYYLKYLDKLATIDCSHNSIKSLHWLHNKKTLNYIDCAYNQLENLSGLENAVDIFDIDCSHNNITTLEHISNLDNIGILNLCYNKLNNINVILNFKELQELDIVGNNFDEKYIEVIEGYCDNSGIRLNYNMSA